MGTLLTPYAGDRRLQHEMHDVLLTNTIELCWIPSHVGIFGNEEADLSAKQASLQAAQPIHVQYTDWYPLLKRRFYEKLIRGWRVRPAKLRDVCDTPGVFYEINLPRRQAVIFNRLRCGHTSLTHSYLMKSDVREVAPGCPVCHNVTLTARHLLLECRELQLISRQCFSIYKRRNDVNIVNVLGSDSKIDELVLFLKRILAYDFI